MNISTKSLLVTVGALVTVQIHAYTFRFHNRLWDHLQVKMQLLGIAEPEETIDLAPNGSGEKSFGDFRTLLAPNYIKLVRINKSADKIDPRRIYVTRIEFDRMWQKYGNMWLINAVTMVPQSQRPVIGDMQFEIVQDYNTGELILVQVI